MQKRQLAAWKNVRNAGTTSLIFGWLGVAIGVLLLIGGIILSLINFEIPSESGDTLPSVALGVMLIIISIFVFILSILQVVAGSKLRKPVAKPKGWLIFVVVMGVIEISSLSGILLLVFGIIALSTIREIDGKNPPKNI